MNIRVPLTLIVAASLFGCEKKTDAPADKKAEKAVTADTKAKADKKSVVVYSGRKESLVGPLLKQFEEKSGIKVDVKYGKTAPLAATILEESEAKTTRAAVFFAQDAGGLGLINQKGLFAKLRSEFTEVVDEKYRARNGMWVGVSGRARTIVAHNSIKDPPKTLKALTDKKYKGKVGWAPGNASFQSHVTALRKLWGEKETKAWLQAMVKNDVKVYPKNTPIVEAVGRKEIDVGLVNHYYLHKLQADKKAMDAVNIYLEEEDGLVNVAGVGILTANQSPEAEKLVEFLLSKEAQEYFANKTYEYPLMESVKVNAKLPPRAKLNPPDLDLSTIDDLQGTLTLLRDVGALD